MGYIKPFFKHIRKPFKRFKLFLKQKAGWLGVPRIYIYRGFGNERQVFVKGIVVEDKGLEKPKPEQGIWQNILAMVKRFSGDEIAGVKVEAKFRNLSQVGETDERGFFSFHFNVPQNQAELSDGWYQVEVELLEPVVENQPVVKSEGEVRVITLKQPRIYVSDIDDTILISHSTRTLKKLRLMLFKNALTRLPFKGVAAFYKKLVKGKEGKSDFPFFYVSSSEWNLYDLLSDFFEHNHIPRGVFMLRELNNSIYKFWKSGQGDHFHKYHKIRFLMEFYPNHTFILFGDSGQDDRIIYNRLALEFDGRVESIFIRNVGKRKKGASNSIRDKLIKKGTSFFEVANTSEAEKNAIGKGYI